MEPNAIASLAGIPGVRVSRHVSDPVWLAHASHGRAWDRLVSRVTAARGAGAVRLARIDHDSYTVVLVPAEAR